jgi:type IX secretion system PorP/SprF family membrane protein
VNILPLFRKIFIFLLFCSGYPVLNAQDIHFSQFFNNPLVSNPALTGNFDGDWRVVGNYRNQWQALGFPYRTLSASYDRQIYIKNHHLSTGFYVLSDKSGSSALSLKRNKIYVSGAYYRMVNKHKINAGLQIGYNDMRYDAGDLTLPGSYDGNKLQYVPGLNIGDLNNSEKTGYIDVNFGLSWSKKIRIFEPQIGFALFHINGPNESFTGTANKVAMRNTLHASLKTNLSPLLFVKPAFMISTQRSSKDFLLGSDVGLSIQGNRFNIREISGGVFVRNSIVDKTDAMVIMFGAQYSNLAFQLSYDINVSPLNKYTNSRGAFELSVIFKSISTIIKTFTIPCERI